MGWLQLIWKFLFSSHFNYFQPAKEITVKLESHWSWLEKLIKKMRIILRQVHWFLNNVWKCNDSNINSDLGDELDYSAMPQDAKPHHDKTRLLWLRSPYPHSRKFFIDSKRFIVDCDTECLIQAYKLEIWPGYFTTIRFNGEKYLMEVEIVHKIMRQDTALSVMHRIRRNDPQNFWVNIYLVSLLYNIFTHFYGRTLAKLSWKGRSWWPSTTKRRIG